MNDVGVKDLCVPRLTNLGTFSLNRAKGDPNRGEDSE